MQFSNRCVIPSILTLFTNLTVNESQGRQKIYDYRHALSTFAVKLVGEYLDSKELDFQGKKEFSTTIAEKHRFIYRDPDGVVCILFRLERC